MIADSWKRKRKRKFQLFFLVVDLIWIPNQNDHFEYSCVAAGVCCPAEARSWLIWVGLLRMKIFVHLTLLTLSSVCSWLRQTRSSGKTYWPENARCCRLCGPERWRWGKGFCRTGCYTSEWWRWWRWCDTSYHWEKQLKLYIILQAGWTCRSYSGTACSRRKRIAASVWTCFPRPTTDLGPTWWRWASARLCWVYFLLLPWLPAGNTRAGMVCS